MKKSECAQIVAMLFAAYPQSKGSESTSAVYEEHLADLDFAATKAAIGRLLKSSKFLPTIAEIREERARYAPAPPALPPAPVERVPYAEVQKLLAGVGQQQPRPSSFVAHRRFTAEELEAELKQGAKK